LFFNSGTTCKIRGARGAKIILDTNSLNLKLATFLKGIQYMLSATTKLASHFTYWSSVMASDTAGCSLFC